MDLACESSALVLDGVSTAGTRALGVSGRDAAMLLRSVRN